MGSATAILAARENPNIKVIVCDSPFSNFYMLCQDLAKSRYHIPKCFFNCCWCFIKSKIQKEANFNLDDLNLLSIVQTLQNDLLIIFLQAKQDELIENKHASLLMENFRGKKKLLSFDGTHNSTRPKDVMEQSVELIKKEFGFLSWNQTSFQKEIKLSSRNSSVNAPLLRASKTSIVPQTEDTEQ
ncbi:unnamed protein product [Paramecium primaurelia]|uniref:Uncharacterized protein n=1 Tax=Paramecium primaurelia TaxID=5886 RepID=A0A8S1LJ95_PARPR|nr:unnamed protein product [Paramecium primaurelia]